MLHMWSRNCKELYVVVVIVGDYSDVNFFKQKKETKQHIHCSKYNVSERVYAKVKSIDS